MAQMDTEKRHGALNSLQSVQAVTSTVVTMAGKAEAENVDGKLRRFGCGPSATSQPEPEFRPVLDGPAT